MTTVAPKPRKKPSIWWRVHAWLGLKLSLFAVVVFLTGTLACIAHEIDWAIDPAQRADPGRAQAASLGLVATNALAAVPGGRIASITRPADPWLATTVVVSRPEGGTSRLLVDPATGEVNRVAGFGSVQRFLRDFHRRLMLPVAIGLPLVGTLAFVLATSLVSGLMSYKKFWRGFFKRPRGGGLRKTSGDLHRLVGLWSLWFVLLVAVTGVWYVVELFGGAAPELRPLKPVQAAAAPLAQPVGAELDALAAEAARAYPGLTIRSVVYPFPGVTAVGFQGEAGSLLTTDKANAVWVDPVTRAIDMKVAARDLTAHQRIAEMADPLHFGTWGGLATKLIWFVFGAGLTGLAVTGVIIYSTRLRTAQAPALAVAARGVGLWAAPVVVLVGVALWLTPKIMAG